jgi:iron complex outermembrane receptor protein
MMIRSLERPARRRVILLAGAGIGALLPGAVLAQSAPTAAVPAQTATLNSGGIEEIVVTAQKRVQSAQNVPIAITALDSNQLAAAGVSGTGDLRAAVPALNVTTATGGYGLPRIRGIGATGQGPGIENPVAVYVDGVYYGAAFGVLQSLYDVEQVAVLKGPQGTLFGRNATGGLIQISTLGPSFDLKVKGQLGYANYGTYSGAGYLSGGLTDTIAVSVSGQYDNQNHGWGKNLFTGNDVQDARSWVGRAKLLWKPDTLTSVLISGDFNGRDGGEPAFRNFGLNTLGQNVQNQIIALGGNPDRDIYSDVDPKLRARQLGTSLTASRNFGGVSLKSITAYRKTDLRFFFDPDGTTQRRTVVDNDQFDKQFTQEINLVSETHGKFDWAIGGFYMHDISGYDPARSTGLLVNGGNGYSDYISDIRNNSYAAFAEGTYHIDASTNLIAGLRYTKDEREATARTVNFVGATGVITTTSTSDDHTFNKVTWRASIDHRFSPELLAYASYNRGFRAGSYVPQTNPLQLLRPEVVDAYEVGIKTDLFDRSVRFNLSGYYYAEKNIQVMQIIAGAQYVYNADGAHIYGIDGDITWKVSSDFRLFGGFNVTHARYTSFTNAIISVPYPLTTSSTLPAGQSCIGTFGNPFAQLGGSCLIRGDASGNKLQNTPSFTGSVGGSYDLHTSIGKFTLAGNYYYNDGYVGQPDERVKQKSFNTIDTSLTWHAPGARYFVRVWGRNLTDAFYRTQIGSSNTGDNGTNGAPRTYGATIGFDL